MVGTQLYIVTQVGTNNYMFRPCILAIVRLYTLQLCTFLFL